MQLRAVAVGSALVLAACGAASEPVADSLPDVAPSASAAPSTTAPSTTAPSTVPGVDDWPRQPPPVVFETPDGPLARAPFTVCWTEPRPADPDQEYQSYCADGMPEDDPPLVEPDGDRVVFSFDVNGWSFTANEHRSGEALPVEQLDDSTWTMTVPGGAVDGDGIVIVSGFGPAGDVHVAISVPTTGVLEESAAGCIAARDAVRAGLPAYEYEPAADIISLIDSVDAVVLGTIDGVRADDGEIEFVLADTTTWGGRDEVTSVVTTGLLSDVAGAGALAGTPMIAFVHRRGDGGFAADVQGLFLQCPGGVVNVIEPLPDDLLLDEIESIEMLVSIVVERKAPVVPDHRIDEVAGVPPGEIAVGETVPVQLWWRCSVGLSVQVGDERYLPAEDIDGLVSRPAPGWVAADFPDEWEVVIYNDVPVDGHDWVLLDAVAERIDDTTLEVSHAGTGAAIGRFVADPTPPNERPMCG